jgi:uncharacterized protein YecT (DUF1311 family)
MKYHMLITIGILTAASASGAQAFECAQARTQGEMTACAAQDLAVQTESINTNYNAYRTRLSPAQKLKFKDVQLAWIKYKDTSCTYKASGIAGGSAYQMVLSQCLSAMTHQRNLEIIALMKCSEGDLACPR